MRHWLPITAMIAASACPLWAGSIAVPGASFETPVTTFINTNVDFWQKPPKPAWYIESGGYQWAQLTGTFKNTAPDSPQNDHIDNCAGSQAIWMFVVPEVAIFQDYNSTDWSHTPAPLHAFTAKFEVGHTYNLTVGIVGGGGGMQEGASLELSLYYRDSGGNRVTVARSTVVHSEDKFPSTNHLVDCLLSMPVVKPTDAWAGQYIGIQILSTVTTELQGGYWDLDNVRLTSAAEPALQNTPSGTDVRVAWLAAPGHQYQLQFSPNLQSWADYGTPVTGSGTGTEASVVYPTIGQPKGFFRVQVTPP